MRNPFGRGAKYIRRFAEAGYSYVYFVQQYFTGKAIERLLEDFGILQYFTKVYASADYGVRKPGEKFFGIAIEEILEKHPGMEKNDILYVGNDYVTDYVTDVQGANAAGRDVAWYNVKGLPNEKGICTCNITKLNEILNVI